MNRQVCFLTKSRNVHRCMRFEVLHVGEVIDVGVPGYNAVWSRM